MKRCTQCQLEKPLESFPTLAAGPLGRHAWCKDCKNATNRQRYADDSERRTRRLAQNKRYRDENRERICAQQRDYRLANRERLLAAKRADYQRDPERHREINLRWKEANPERHQFLQRRSHLKQRYGLTVEQFDAMFEEQGRACAICKVPFVKRPHVDHDHSCCPGLTSCGRCIRGLLCGPCNRLLGWYESKVDAFRVYVDRRR